MILSFSLVIYSHQEVRKFAPEVRLYLVVVLQPCQSLFAIVFSSTVVVVVVVAVVLVVIVIVAIAAAVVLYVEASPMFFIVPALFRCRALLASHVHTPSPFAVPVVCWILGSRICLPFSQQFTPRKLL